MAMCHSLQCFMMDEQINFLKQDIETLRHQQMQMSKDVEVIRAFSEQMKTDMKIIIANQQDLLNWRSYTKGGLAVFILVAGALGYSIHLILTKLLGFHP